MIGCSTKTGGFLLMNNEKSGIIIASHILTILQLICCGFSVFALTRFSAFAAGVGGDPTGGSLLILFSIWVCVAMIPLSIATGVVDILVLKQHGRRMHTILSLLFSVALMIVAFGIIITEMV